MDRSKSVGTTMLIFSYVPNCRAVKSCSNFGSRKNLLGEQCWSFRTFQTAELWSHAVILIAVCHSDGLGEISREEKFIFSYIPNCRATRSCTHKPNLPPVADDTQTSGRTHQHGCRQLATEKLHSEIETSLAVAISSCSKSPTLCAFMSNSKGLAE